MGWRRHRHRMTTRGVLQRSARRSLRRSRLGRGVDWEAGWVDLVGSRGQADQRAWSVMEVANRRLHWSDHPASSISPLSPRPRRLMVASSMPVMQYGRSLHRKTPSPRSQRPSSTRMERKRRRRRVSRRLLHPSYLRSTQDRLHHGFDRKVHHIHPRVRQRFQMR